jgi:hypothetical protein
MINRALFHQRQLRNIQTNNFPITFDEVIFYKSHEKTTQQIYQRLFDLIKTGDVIHIDSITIAGPTASSFTNFVQLIEKKNAALRLWFPESNFHLSCLINRANMLIEEQKCDDSASQDGEKELTCQLQIKNSNLSSVSKKELDALIKATVDK